jgi:arsenate reductase
MAEGLARHLKGNLISPFSAGITPKGLDSNAVEVMKEIGIDISSQYSKSTSQLGNTEFDYVITLCDSAQKNCPFFPARYGIIHRSFDDPIRFAENETDKREKLKHYRRVRDEIKAFIDTLPGSLVQNKQQNRL